MACCNVCSVDSGLGAAQVAVSTLICIVFLINFGKLLMLKQYVMEQQLSTVMWCRLSLSSVRTM